jgi:hypothetical protein
MASRAVTSGEFDAARVTHEDQTSVVKEYP